MHSFSDRQLEIICAAGKILTQDGLAGLTIKKLALEMQFSESALYRHFESKEAILVAMLHFLKQNIDQRLSVIVDTDQSIESKIKAIFDSQLSFFNTNRHFLIAVFSDGLLQENQQINQAILGLMQMKTSHLLPLIAAGQKQLIFTTDIQADAILHLFMGSFRLQMLKWKLAHFENDIQFEGQNMIQSILILIKYLVRKKFKHRS